jgi:flotillin
MEKRAKEGLSKQETTTAFTVIGGIGIMALAASRYKVAKPNEMLVKTGLGLKQKLQLSRSTVAWPFQRVSPISVAPRTVAVNINGMSHERVPFKLPIVVTVGPNTENPSALLLYAEKLSQKDPEEVHHLIRDIIAGQSRIITASMTADELFHERDTFKRQVSDGVEQSLQDLGLKVYNANLEELGDEPGCSYFEEQRKRSLSNVHAEAVVQVALAQTKGEVGSKEQESQRRMQTARLEAEAQLQENDRQLEISRSLAELAIAQADLQKRSSVATAEAKAAVEQKTLMLQQEIQRQRALEETERLRADELATKVVEAEKLIRETGGHTEADRLIAENKAKMQLINTNAQTEADRLVAENKAKMQLINTNAQTEADRLIAENKAKVQLISVEAQAKATRTEAEAQLYAQEQRAQGITQLGQAEANALLARLNAEAQGKLAMLQAEAQGLDELVKAAGGAEQYLAQSMIKQETLPEIAKAQADAVRGMKPVIWNQTNGSPNIVQSLCNDLPPYFDGLKHITGLDVTGFIKEKLKTNEKLL